MSTRKHVLVAGAHKTSTSAMQDFFSADSILNTGELQYIPHRMIRKLITKPSQVNSYHELGIPWGEEESVVEKELVSELVGLSKSEFPLGTLLVEENVLGHPGQVVRSGNLYRFRDKFAQSFARGYSVPVTDIVYSIRNYCDFFNSSYSEYLRSVNLGRTNTFISPEKFKAKIFKKMPYWWACLRALGGAFPKAQLTVLLYESTSIDARIAEVYRLCGIPTVDSRVRDARQKQLEKMGKDIGSRRRRLSHSAYEKIINSINELGEEKAGLIKQEVIDVDDGTLPMQIFSPGERNYLNHVYECDKRRLIKGFDDLNMRLVGFE